MPEGTQEPAADPKMEPTTIEHPEDAETRATRRELKQSSISEKLDSDEKDKTEPEADSRQPETPRTEESERKANDLADQVSSPKKKRAHDQLEGHRDAQEDDSASVVSNDSGKDRATRLEPEKKRHRDGEPLEMTLETAPSDTEPATTAKDIPNADSNKTLASSRSSAFASSGFGKLASGSSGFASLGLSKGKAFSHAPSEATQSAFGSVGATGKGKADTAHADSASQPPKLSFGSNSSASPFAGVSSGVNGFGGSPFGLALTGLKQMGSFSAVGGAKPLQSDKVSKPFGAPDSDAEEEEEEEEEGEGDGENRSQADHTERAASPEKEIDDKKRPRLHKIEVDDGEAGEATVVSVRAKMFSLDREAGWKERGAGMLKINVPKSCIDFDENGAVIPGTFDASGLETDGDSKDEDPSGHKVARLILRQDQTHRVILNTAIVPAMQFQEKASLKSVAVLFTALEGAEPTPVRVTMRMSAANARIFMNEIGDIQRELRGN